MTAVAKRVLLKARLLVLLGSTMQRVRRPCHKATANKSVRTVHSKKQEPSVSTATQFARTIRHDKAQIPFP